MQQRCHLFNVFAVLRAPRISGDHSICEENRRTATAPQAEYTPLLPGGGAGGPSVSVMSHMVRPIRVSLKAKGIPPPRGMGIQQPRDPTPSPSHRPPWFLVALGGQEQGLSQGGGGGGVHPSQGLGASQLPFSSPGTPPPPQRPPKKLQPLSHK